jgi:hypothetical protein
MKKKEKIESLEKLLVETYRSQFRPGMSSNWRRGVMRTIGQIKRQEEQLRSSLFERLFPTPILFKFAGVSGACALVLMAFFLTSGGGVNQELSRLFLNDPLGMMSLALLAP